MCTWVRSLSNSEIRSALDGYRKALAIREALLAITPDDTDGRLQLARIYESLGAYSFVLAGKNNRTDDWRESRRRYQQSLDTGNDLQRRGKLKADFLNKPDEMKERLLKCEAALRN
jgi:hypothetical protein